MQTHFSRIRVTLEGTSLLFFPVMQNPAETPTKDSYLKNDDIKEFWLGGPPFFQLSHEGWPSRKHFENYKSNESHCLAELSNSDIDTDMKKIFTFENYNSFKKLIRTTSSVLRFIGNMKPQVENKT